MDKISIRERFRSGWNAFMNKDPTYSYDAGINSYAYRPDRPRFSRGMERSIITSILTRIAIDSAMTDIKHVRLDTAGRYDSDVESGLNYCLTTEANLDQTGFDFKLDIVTSLLDEGCIAIVPIDTNDSPYDRSFEIETMRVGKILEWYPDKVRVKVYNERKGEHNEIVVPKRLCAIIQNPLYAIMNEPNSTLQRLIRKLALLDSVDEQSSSGKLDLIIQLPYIVKSEARRKQAEQRRKDIEDQLTGKKYGIAYTDGTEKITQLNRSVENQLMSQIEYLTNLLFSQLGVTQTILDGTADEQTLLNYYQRTINPIITAIVAEMNRKFIGKTAKSQGQAIQTFRDPFKMVPVNNIADIADKFTRNEILSSNEIRQIIGIRPSDDPKADQLLNSNLNHNEGEEEFAQEEEGYENYKEE